MITKSIVIPCYNEQNTIVEILNKVDKNINKNDEIIIVDDCSTDKTKEILKSLNLNNENIKIFTHELNQGKGAALQTAFKECKKDIILIQDADLEYDPKDYKLLVQPIVSGKAEVVYGSRVLDKRRYSLKSFSSIYRIFFNHLLTIFSNVMNNQNLTDAHTCYKTFSTELFNSIDLNENDFSFCPEITTKIAKKGIRIKEVPIEYYGRSYKEGKKINILDGFKALFTIIRYRFLK